MLVIFSGKTSGEEEGAKRRPLRKWKRHRSVCRTLFSLADGLGGRNSKNLSLQPALGVGPMVLRAREDR